MQWDREKPAHRVKDQDEILREYLTQHLYPYSPFYRRRFDATKLAPKNVNSLRDLAAKLQPVGWSDVAAEPAAFLLRPTERAIAKYGERKLVMAIARAKLRGRVAQVNQELIDPAYKPIHWHLDGEVPIGYSKEDLGRFGEAGKRVLQLAGLGRDDVIANLNPPGPYQGFWQMVDGAREAGISSVNLGPGAGADRLAASAPTTLAGPPVVLESALRAVGAAGGRLAGLRTLLVVGAVLDDFTRDGLRALGRSAGEADLEVVCAWAPPGVRAMWGECRGGRGLHTYPDLEFLEVLPDGEVAWTSLAWHGTVVLRLRVGVPATLEDVPCPTCGRVGPRFVAGQAQAAAEIPAVPAVSASGFGAAPAHVPAFGPPSVSEDGRRLDTDDAEFDEDEVILALPALDFGRLRVLDDHPSVAAWAAEYRLVDGDDELIVFVAPSGVDRLGPLFRELDATVKAAQYVVERPEKVHERVERDGLVLDRR